MWQARYVVSHARTGAQVRGARICAARPTRVRQQKFCYVITWRCYAGVLMLLLAATYAPLRHDYAIIYAAMPLYADAAFFASATADAAPMPLICHYAVTLMLLMLPLFDLFDAVCRLRRERGAPCYACRAYHERCHAFCLEHAISMAPIRYAITPLRYAFDVDAIFADAMPLIILTQAAMPLSLHAATITSRLMLLAAFHYAIAAAADVDECR